MSEPHNTAWLPRLPADAAPIYRAIADAIGAAVADGTLQPDWSESCQAE